MTSAMLTLLVTAVMTLGGYDDVREVHEVTFNIGGASVRALCTDGPRDVILLHDAGSSADAWRPVLERLDQRVGACAYDRRGSGKSRPVPDERGWYELLDELRHVHRALGFDHDYLMVGHGLGGLYARMYVIDRPREVGAMLLVSPDHEDMPLRFEAGMPEDLWRAWVARRQAPNADGIVEASLGARLRRSRTPRIPVTVLTAATHEGGPGWDPRFIVEASQALHAEILQGAAVPRHIPAGRSGHDVPRDQPDLIVDEIIRLRGFLGG